MRLNQSAGPSFSQASRLTAPSSRSQCTSFSISCRSPLARRASIKSLVSSNIFFSSAIPDPSGFASLLDFHRPAQLPYCQQLCIHGQTGCHFQCPLQPFTKRSHIARVRSPLHLDCHTVLLPNAI